MFRVAKEDRPLKRCCYTKRQPVFPIQNAAFSITTDKKRERERGEKKKKKKTEKEKGRFFPSISFVVLLKESESALWKEEEEEEEAKCRASSTPRQRLLHRHRINIIQRLKYTTCTRTFCSSNSSNNNGKINPPFRAAARRVMCTTICSCWNRISGTWRSARGDFRRRRRRRREEETTQKSQKK